MNVNGYNIVYIFPFKINWLNFKYYYWSESAKCHQARGRLKFLIFQIANCHEYSCSSAERLNCKLWWRWQLMILLICSGERESLSVWPPHSSFVTLSDCWHWVTTQHTAKDTEQCNKAKRSRPRGARDGLLLLSAAFLRVIILSLEIYRGRETETTLRQCQNNVSLVRCQERFYNLAIFLHQKMTEDSSTLNQLQEELKAADEVRKKKKNNISKIKDLISDPFLSEIRGKYCSVSHRTVEDPGNPRKQSSWRRGGENQWVSGPCCRKCNSQEEDKWKRIWWWKFLYNLRTWREKGEPVRLIGFSDCYKMLFSEEEDGRAEVSGVQFQMFWRCDDENPPDHEPRRPEEDENLSELCVFLHQRLGGDSVIPTSLSVRTVIWIPFADGLPLPVQGSQSEERRGNPLQEVRLYCREQGRQLGS